MLAASSTETSECDTRCCCRLLISAAAAARGEGEGPQLVAHFDDVRARPERRLDGGRLCSPPRSRACRRSVGLATNPAFSFALHLLHETSQPCTGHVRFRRGAGLRSCGCWMGHGRLGLDAAEGYAKEAQAVSQVAAAHCHCCAVATRTFELTSTFRAGGLRCMALWA
eukprot:COSAG01_NODE_10034_length_2269_cov_2.316129_2_plen_168_part_00